MLDIKRVLASRPRKKADGERSRELLTPWGERLLADEAGALSSAALHPHPQFQRDAWLSLDGMWDYAIQPISSSPTSGEPWRDAKAPQEFDGRIRVPFSPEALLSGVGRQLQPDEVLWYQCEVELPSALAGLVAAGQRLFLHFEAVDYACAVYVNGRLLGEHKGAYLPFSFDVTDALDAAGSSDASSSAGSSDALSAADEAGASGTASTLHAAAESEDPESSGPSIPSSFSIMVCAWDPSDEGTQLRGKQRLERGGIWYTAQSGIWQTVWLEVAPAAHIVSVTLNPQADAGALEITAAVCIPHEQPVSATPEQSNPAAPVLSVTLFDGNGVLAKGSAKVSDSHGHDGEFDIVHLVVPVPNPHLWSPDDPHLYQLELTFGDDIVHSYTAFRTVGMESVNQGAAQGRPRFCLNHEPLFIRGLLDQGYWSDGLMTAPADDALIFDIKTARDLGFNLLRKHIKIECDRFYYHCDRLGMFVMQDMPSGGGAYGTWQTSYKPTFFRGSWAAQSDTTSAARTALAADDAAYRAEWSQTCEDAIRYLGNHPCIVSWCLFNEGWGQFDARRAFERVRELDPTRVIDAVSGWYDQGCGDFQSVHNYFRPLEVYADPVQPPRAFLISEFGGLSLAIAGHTSFDSEYGYGSFRKRSELTLGVRGLIAQAEALEREGLSGFVYTQLSDVEEEVNGLVTFDRRVVKLKD